MQTPKLPIQFTSASPAPATLRSGQNGGGDAQFSAALSREVNQRQQKTAMPAPAKTAPPAKAEQARPVDKTAVAKAAAADEASAAPAKAGSTAPGKDDAAEGADAQATAAADAAAAGAPALDMLALVASLNLPGAAAPAPRPCRASCRT
jgi:flagellar hook-length control protein FliK